MSSGSEPRRMLVMVGRLVSPDHPLIKQAEARGIEILYPPQPVERSEARLAELVRGVHATIAGTEPYTARVIAGSSLKVISRTGVGYDAIDVAAATSRGVAVCTTRGTNAEAVADHAFGLILALARRLFTFDRAIRQQTWPRPDCADVHRQTLGIIGLGRIGKRVARRARGFDMRIVAHDPVWDDAFAAEHQVERLGLEEVVKTADFLSLHLPSSAETRHIVNAETLALMKPTAYLINVSRGPLVDEEALGEALRAGRIAGAGLDVFEREPLGASPLLAMDNVILTPPRRLQQPELERRYHSGGARERPARARRPATQLLSEPRGVRDGSLGLHRLP